MAKLQKKYLTLVMPNIFDFSEMIEIPSGLNEIIWQVQSSRPVGIVTHEWVITATDAFPTIGVLVQPNNGHGDLSKPVFHWQLLYKGLVRVTDRKATGKLKYMVATVAPFRRPAGKPNREDVAALRAAAAQYLHVNPRGRKGTPGQLDVFRAEGVQAVQAAKSDEALVWWLVDNLRLPAELRFRLITSSLADQVSELHEWLAAPEQSKVGSTRPLTDEDRRFIQSICQSPHDEALRLVYADWLEEQSDPRGEFIRLDCRHDSFARRSELREAHGHEWERPLRAALGIRDDDPSAAGRILYDWGFPTVHILHLSTFLLRGEGLLTSAPVRRLCLVLERGARARNKELKELAASPMLGRLTQIQLCGPELPPTNEDDPDEDSWEASGIDDEGVQILANSPHFAAGTSLILTANPIGLEGVRVLAESPHLAHLGELHLNSIPLHNEAVALLAASQTLAALRKLNLKNTDSTAKSKKLLKARFGDRVDF